MSDHLKQFYIDGAWVEPHGSATLDVINPATEEPAAQIALGDATDVDRAVAAAKSAFATYGQSSREERIDLLERIIAVYERRSDDIAAAVSLEMGAPKTLAQGSHAPSGLGHLRTALAVLREFEFEQRVGSSSVVLEPIGVCGMITPWNWPLNQIGAKLAPALAAGCTMVLKPSEIAPLSALIVAEVLDEAGTPPGVFNLVNGDGATVGTALASHPDVDMVSFTGSTRAGIEVARNAAPTVKRVAQELGGKSANIVLDDADLEQVVTRDVARVYGNCGQSCNALARLLVPADRADEAAEIASRATAAIAVGLPEDPQTTIGPLASETQWNKVQGLLEQAIAEGAQVVTGGPGRPEGLTKGYFVKPTVLAGVTSDMTIAREEIFGPVVTIIGYRDEEDAIAIANDTVYGLSGAVSSADHERARRVARRLRTGMVHVNGGRLDNKVPFGGYRQSGNGREFGEHGLREYLEAKSIYGDNV